MPVILEPMPASRIRLGVAAGDDPRLALRGQLLLGHAARPHRAVHLHRWVVPSVAGLERDLGDRHTDAVLGILEPGQRMRVELLGSRRLLGGVGNPRRARGFCSLIASQRGAAGGYAGYRQDCVDGILI